MACATSIEEAVSIASARWPGYEFIITSNEAHGPCPVCGLADTDGFIIFATGYALCRPGNHHLWLDDDKQQALTAEELRLRRIEAEQARQARKDAEAERRMTAHERMHACQDHISYHKALSKRDREYWHDQGIFDATIDAYGLGVCYRCPTDSKHRPSRTIPVVNGAKLWNIWHRLLEFDGTPVEKDKYRPHMAGLGSTLFNADNVYKPDSGSIIIAEGQKKSIVIGQYGFESVGTMGAAGFKQSWSPRFERFDLVYVCYDPDAQDKAAQVASYFNGRGRVVRLPVKADDFFNLYHGTPADFDLYLGLARKNH